MQQISVIFLMTLSFLGAQGLIVPQELPSLLSLVYSTIPQIKKGTDSRFGFGFRLGEHADFQVQLELGPQKETQPIGESTSSSSKRHVNQNDYNAIAKGSSLSSQSSSPSSFGKRAEGSSWLSNWSKDMQSEVKSKKNKTKGKASNSSILDKTEGPKQLEDIKTAPMISESALIQLQSLYKLAESGALSSTSIPNPTVTSTEIQPNLLDIISPRNKNSVPAAVSIDSKKPNKDQIAAELMDVELE